MAWPSFQLTYDKHGSSNLIFYECKRYNLDISRFDCEWWILLIIEWIEVWFINNYQHVWCPMSDDHITNISERSFVSPGVQLWSVPTVTIRVGTSLASPYNIFTSTQTWTLRLSHGHWDNGKIEKAFLTFCWKWVNLEMEMSSIKRKYSVHNF